jgi:hypothetical protein
MRGSGIVILGRFDPSGLHLTRSGSARQAASAFDRCHRPPASVAFAASFRLQALPDTYRRFPALQEAAMDIGVPETEHEIEIAPLEEPVPTPDPAEQPVEEPVPA